MTTIPARLSYTLAHNFLREVIIDVIDEYPRGVINARAFAAYLETEHKKRFVQYVQAKTDWPSVAADNLISAKEVLECYQSPEKFKEAVDDALFLHFKAKIQDFEECAGEILRSLADRGPDPMQVYKDRVEADMCATTYKLPKLN